MQKSCRNTIRSERTKHFRGGNCLQSIHCKLQINQTMKMIVRRERIYVFCLTLYPKAWHHAHPRIVTKKASIDEGVLQNSEQIASPEEQTNEVSHTFLLPCGQSMTLLKGQRSLSQSSLISMCYTSDPNLTETHAPNPFRAIACIINGHATQKSSPK